MIYNIIIKAGTITREVKRAKANNKIKSNELDVNLSNNLRETKRTLIDNQIKNLQADEDLRIKQLKVKQEQQKGTILLFYSLISSVISALLSICGLNDCNSLTECVKDLQSIAITSLFVFFASLNLIVSYYSTHNKENYSNIQTKWNIFQTIFLFTSITSNIIFLVSQQINIMLSIVLAILLDVSSVLAIENYNAKKYKNKSLATEQQQDDVINMLITILTHKFTSRIKQRYNQIMQQNVPTTQYTEPQHVISLEDNKNTQDVKTVAIERKKDVNEDNNNYELIHTSNSKVTQEQFEQMLKGLDIGTVVTPKLLGMQNCRHLFYKFKDSCDMIKKIDNNYVRV